MQVHLPFASPQPRVQQQQFFLTVQPTPQVHMQPGQQFFPQQEFGIKMPAGKEMKQPIERFTEKEKYRGLGARYKDWELQVLDELGAAQQFSGGEWPEEFKMGTLN